jgi:para-aminobenzoate synthetase component 1
MGFFRENVSKSVKYRISAEKVGSDVALDCLSKVFSGYKDAAILGGNKNSQWNGGCSYWMAKPLYTFEFYLEDDKPFKKLDTVLDKFCLQNKPDYLPEGIFCGGWSGFFGYELGRFIEKLPSKAKYDLPLPVIRLGFYDKVICYDHKTGEFWLTALYQDKPDSKIKELKEILKQAESVSAEYLDNEQSDEFDFSFAECNMSRDYYLKAVDKIKRHIYDGDVYQVNFSQRFNPQLKAEAIKLFLWQNRNNPSGYSGYINGGDFQIVSASPEMFITACNGEIHTKPIKGTRRRFQDKTQDAQNKENLHQLKNCEKEKAELNMIIDLERNDLGRICEYGTIKVTQPRTLESYPTVFHAVATVSGRLREEITFSDILKAMFPGGSITGAPKIRSMEIIDQLEPTARGVYTGSIGFIGIDGSVCLNIAIRTVIISGQSCYVQVGGGIVADSIPAAELKETLVKGRALMEGIKKLQSLQ